MEALNILLQITIYSAVLFCTILFIKFLFNNMMSPFLHYALWGLMIARLLIPVTLESSVHFFVIPAKEENQAVSEQPVSLSPDMSDSQYDIYPDDAGMMQSGINEGMQAQENAFPAPASPAENVSAVSAGDIILAIWLSGAGIGITYLAILYIILRKRVLKNAQIPSKKLLELFEEVKKELNIKRNIRIVGQCEYGAPAVFCPKTVLMPIDTLVSMSEEQVKYVLRHELMHLKRGDHIVSLLLSLLNAIYWFNPIIWIAARFIRSDMETACDSDVVRHFNKNEKSEYASIILTLFSKKQYGNLALGMVKGNTKKIAEKRIRGVFMRHKTNNKIKAASGLMCALLLFACFTTACQPTPEETIVKSKAGDEIQQAIDTTAEPDSKKEVSHITESAINDLNTITVNIDSDVTVPDADSMPMATVERGSFTQEQLDKFIEVLFGDVPLYDSNVPLTKDEIMEEILKLKRSATDLESDMAQSEGITTLAELQERADELIAEREKQYAVAPDTPQYVEADTDVTTPILYNDNEPTIYKGEPIGSYVSAIADLGKENMAWLDLSKSLRGDHLGFSNFDTIGFNMFQLRGSVPAGTKQPDGVTMGYEDAKRLAIDMLSALNLNENFSFGNAYIGRSTDMGDPEDKQYYVFFFERIINGVHVTHDFHGIATTSSDDPAYAEPLRYENLNMWVDDTGVVQVYWDSPLNVTEIVNDNVEMAIDAKKAAEVMTKQLFLQYADMFYGNAERIEIDITGIRLGLARIRYRGHPGEYILAPVWDFYGEVKLKLTESSDLAKEATLDEDGMYMNNFCHYQSIGTINALDGSVVNRDLGY